MEIQSLGVQEIGSSEDREFMRWGVLEFRSLGNEEFKSLRIMEFRR